MEITWTSTKKDAPWETRDITTGSTRSAANVVSKLAVGDVTGQIMQGFGACFNELGWITLQKLPEADRRLILDSLFHQEKGCAFNYCRLPIGANDYAASWYSHNETDGDYAMESFSVNRDEQYLIPFIREGLSYCPDMTLFASPWSPPTWMKSPKDYRHARLVQTPENLKAYALYFRKFVEAYKERGIHVDAVHIQNEPKSDHWFPSCPWDPAEMRDFIRDYIGPEFEEAGTDCEIWLGTIEAGLDTFTKREGYKDWAGLVLDDPEARKYIKGIGYQWEGKGAVQRTHLAYPDLPIIQTENECCNADCSWAQAHYIFDLMWHYIHNGAVAYVNWNMVLQPGGMSTWGWKQNSMITVFPETGEMVYNPEYYAMRHVSAYVTPGAKRLNLTGNWCVNALGFQNPDGTQVLVVQNASEEERSLEITLSTGETKSFLLAPESFHTICIKG